ncbi:MAG: hypothetical protein IPK00_25670 [Deltaproteobacteria bacterium]|nr:hypothetical protein [Deltaproteobacteria bacterium]
MESPVESLVNPVGVGLLLSALYMLRYRAWRRPILVVAYFAFFTSLEWVAAHYFLPPDALPSVIGWLCLGLTVPVLVATWLVWRQEQRHGEGA